MYKLAPSILSADFANLGCDIRKIESAGAEYVHIDVMDGAFVPSISFGVPIIKSIRSISNCFFDVHLMVEEPIRYIEDFVKAGADNITIHAEACRHLHRTITAIKDLGIKVSVALNPSTPLSVLEYVIEDIDMVLIMTVNPGFGGQTFIETSYKKIRDLKQFIIEKNLELDIQVDGGITLSNLENVLSAGANVIVAGTSVFSGDIEKNVITFEEVFSRAAEGIKIR